MSRLAFPLPSPVISVPAAASRRRVGLAKERPTRTGSSPRRASILLPLLGLMLGCTDGQQIVATDASSVVAMVGSTRSATRTSVNFTVGPLVLSTITIERPDGRMHFRDITLSGPVTGSLTGTATLTLNANLDAPGGSGPAWGTVNIVASPGEWTGSLTGHFEGAPPTPGIQLFSQVVLHGPDGERLLAECDETSALSETLVCTGEMLSPRP